MLEIQIAGGIFILITIQMTGCVGMGPERISSDRFNYLSAISESWKQQLLLNLLKTRYSDAPVFMDVVSVISQYSLEGQVQVGATWWGNPFAHSQNIAGAGKYTDRPTITYAPLMGEKFTRSFMTPIPVS